MVIDSHVHYEYSYDGYDTVADVCRATHQQGVAVLTLTDYCDMRSHKHGYPFYFPIAERRWKEIEEAKGAFPTIKLLIGLELGDVSNNVELARQHLQQYDYDFVLGSVHHIRDERNQRFENLCPTDLVAAYLEEMDALVDFGAFDTLAHLDYPAKMWDVPQSVFSYFQDRIDAILKRIVEKNIALEINSSMLFKPTARLLP